MQNTVAKRYAAALYEIAREHILTEEISQQLDQLSLTWQDQNGLNILMTSPRVGLSQKRQILAELGQKLQLGQVMTNLLNLMLEKGRIDTIPDLAEEFRLLDDKHAGRTRVHCSSPHPLSELQLGQLREKLLKISGAKDVLITLEIDPSLLAGIVVSIDGKIIDGSIKGRLQRLQQSLAQPIAETARLR